MIDEGDEGGGTDGLDSDADGRLYVTSYEHNAVLRRDLGGSYDTLVADPRMLFPDSLALGPDGLALHHVNQLHRQPSYWWGQDRRQRPYAVCRVRVGSSPVRLR